MLYFTSGGKMPNKPVHLVTSGSVGTICAYMNAPTSGAGTDRFLEVAGGVLGGVLGGLLPDVFDPPCHPHHRSLAHGVLPVIAGAGVWVLGLAGWQTHLREQAEAYSRLRVSTVDPFLAAWYGFVEMALRVLCGTVAGLGADTLLMLRSISRRRVCLPLIN
jgi:hypothetical protein